MTVSVYKAGDQLIDQMNETLDNDPGLFYLDRGTPPPLSLVYIAFE